MLLEARFLAPWAPSRRARNSKDLILIDLYTTKQNAERNYFKSLWCGGIPPLLMVRLVGQVRPRHPGQDLSNTVMPNRDFPICNIQRKYGWEGGSEWTSLGW